MQFHHQLIVDPQRGDCFRTCLACVLDLASPTEVPNFTEADEGHIVDARISEWLASRGYGQILIHHDGGHWKGDLADLVDALCIMCVPSARFEGGYHAVVGQVRLEFTDETKHSWRTWVDVVHDPSPTNPPYPWYMKPLYARFLVPIHARLPRYAGPTLGK